MLTRAFLAGKEGSVLDDGSSSGADGEAAPSEEAGWELVRFKRTPKMSTYLAAWAVGKFRQVVISRYHTPQLHPQSTY